jgi:hypothetical protein
VAFVVLVLFVFGIYSFVKRARGKQLPDEAKEFGGRLGRSIHGSVPLPGLMGQAPASMMGERGPDEIGPEEEHVVVMKPPEGPRGDEPSAADLEEVRSRLDAMFPPDPPRPRRPRRPPPEG